MAVLVRPPAARAEGDKETAQRLFVDGKKLYDVGEYQKALDDFKRAYLAYEDPSLLFNMALCHRALGNKTEAVRTYKSYLRNVPEANNGAEVERVIRQLENELAAEKREPPVSPPPPPSPEQSPEQQLQAPQSPMPPSLTSQAVTVAPKKKRSLVWLWPVAGVVVAGAALGLGLGLTLGRPSEGALQPVQF